MGVGPVPQIHKIHRRDPRAQQAEGQKPAGRVTYLHRCCLCEDRCLLSRCCVYFPPLEGSTTVLTCTEAPGGRSGSSHKTMSSSGSPQTKYSPSNQETGDSGCEILEMTVAAVC